MKRTYITVLVAVFLSMIVGGCYTVLQGPEPGTGERVYHNYYDGYPYYYDNYYPYYFQFGWYSPYFFGSPSYYDYFYNPWWYNPYYGDGYYYPGHGGYPSGKEPRVRGGQKPNLPTPPSGSYSPPPPSTGPGETSKPSNPSSGGNQGSSGNQGEQSGGKATRGRR